MFQKIAFIHYCTENLERAIRFYRDILGLQVLVQNEEWIEFAIGDQRLALRQVNSMPPNPEGPNPNGAMVWLLAQPIEKSISQLKENNINIINELSIFSYGKTATFSDPDGNLIGLYEPPSKK
ncbi:MAG: VOC family protein [Nitrospinota bacterium]|nr:VOC family protein [Nitrospinota bacterium]